MENNIGFSGGDLVSVKDEYRDKYNCRIGIVVRQQTARCFHIIEHKGDCNRDWLFDVNNEMFDLRLKIKSL